MNIIPRLEQLEASPRGNEDVGFQMRPRDGRGETGRRGKNRAERVVSGRELKFIQMVVL